MTWLPRMAAWSVAFALASGSAIALQEPESAQAGTWAGLTGTVTTVKEDRFKMDYGDGTMTVGVADWQTYNKQFELGKGDKVTVYGRVDKGLYESAALDAASIFVEDLNSYFYASPTDEEEFGGWAIRTDYEPGAVVYIGKVESVNRVQGFFTIDTGKMELTVDTTNMLYNPLDEEGFQQIQVGDRVSVEGAIDDDFFQGSEMIADSVVTLESSGN
ncbi:OB-fold nucleic acid binding domain-containing protein [Algiphilus sp.]|uniref:OB-fold nucleic acid binding domain-containing protein n=1 Tax=Algiphilus sp. TaxID=1872431 RepID=UPI003B51585F